MWNDVQNLFQPLQSWSLPFAVLVAMGGMSMLFFYLGRRSVARPVPPAPAVEDKEKPTSSQEKRKYGRRVGNLKAVYWSKPLETHNRSEAVILNRSMNGVGLGMDHPMEIGTKLMLLPTTASSMTPWVEVEVRYSREGDSGFWEVGCQFIQMPPYATLVLFG